MSYNNGLTEEDVYLTAYRRVDGSVVVHVETPGLSENSDGPELTIYLNEDLDNPLWSNRPPAIQPGLWRCPGCMDQIEPSVVRRHVEHCDRVSGDGTRASDDNNKASDRMGSRHARG